MNLQDLIKSGALIDEGVTQRSVTWEGHSFTVLVKNEMSAGDFEYIFGIGQRKEKGIDDNDEAHMARRVHRLVRIGEKGADLVPYDQAVRMKLSLLLAICAAINEVHGQVLGEKDPKA